MFIKRHMIFSIVISITMACAVLGQTTAGIAPATAPATQPATPIKPGYTGNPILPGRGACDPSIRIFNGRAYLYATHDVPMNAPERKGKDWYFMQDWWIWSSDDLIHWKHENTLQPSVLGFPEGFSECWATDALERKGKYFWYVCTGKNTYVVTGDTPTGPWRAPLGNKPLMAGRDPAPFIDDDGKAYLVTGVEHYNIAQLGDDMISLAHEPRKIVINKQRHPDDKPYLHTRNGWYYLSWGCYYAMSRNVYGPYDFKGSVLQPESIDPELRQPSWDNDRHGSFFQWHGQWYFICNTLANGAYFRDSVIGYVNYKDNGEMDTVRLRKEGVTLPPEQPRGNSAQQSTATSTTQPAATSTTRPDAGVEFSSSNPMLQRIFTAIVLANLKNEDHMEDGKKVLVEGDIWRGLWLETQPMGGSMYAKFDLEIARNNFDVILDRQWENGKLPSLVRLKGPLGTHQAVGFNAPAQYGLDLYYLLNKDPAFLDKLENALTRYDAFLWESRGTKGNGVLVAYCTSDTGEDGQANNRYDLGRERDKTKNPRFVYSVSVTADSYANRSVLAQIALIKGDEAKRQEWQTKADTLQKRAKEYFWVEDRHAAFDRDSNGNVLPTLNQLNIRAMTQGLFTQQMAEDFVRRHLMNPEEFFTPYPIPSTAVNDPKFINMDKNSEYCSWAGPSMGLTLQRCVKALENYGFYAEIGMIGERFLNRIGQEPVRFPVQFDPLTGKPAGKAGAYGPMVLASMEYLSRMYGVYVYRDSVVWNGLSGGGDLEYKQTWHQKHYRLVNREGRVSGFLNGRKLFEVPAGLHIETDYEGNVKKIAGLASSKVSGPLLLGATETSEFTIDPDQMCSVSPVSRLR